ncbi:MAG: hypothetical protein ACFFCO_05615 [Promethearchaeota archaeon]
MDRRVQRGWFARVCMGVPCAGEQSVMGGRDAPGWLGAATPCGATAARGLSGVLVSEHNK